MIPRVVPYPLEGNKVIGLAAGWLIIIVKEIVSR